ncbi:unnamed protein product [Amaranthus hypochondriacus]
MKSKIDSYLGCSQNVILEIGTCSIPWSAGLGLSGAYPGLRPSQTAMPQPMNWIMPLFGCGLQDGAVLRLLDGRPTEAPSMIKHAAYSATYCSNIKTQPNCSGASPLLFRLAGACC